MKKILNIIEKISKAGSYLACLFMLLIVGLISLEIFLRTFFKKSTLIADEYSAYFMVACVFLGLAYTLGQEKHIKITLITSRIKNKFYKLCLDLFSLLIAFLVSVFSLYYSYLMVKETYLLDMRADSIAETSLWIPELSVPIGFLLLSLQMLTLIIRRIRKL
jgi:TRAP-type C4-dicarboxylate transport system permease small subunit